MTGLKLVIFTLIWFLAMCVINVLLDFMRNLCYVNPRMVGEWGGGGSCDEHLFISLEKGKIYHVLSRYASIVCMCTVKLAITALKSTRYFKWTEIFRGVTRASGAPLQTIDKSIKTFHTMHLNIFSFICKHNTIGKK